MVCSFLWAGKNPLKLMNGTLIMRHIRSRTKAKKKKPYKIGSIICASRKLNASISITNFIGIICGWGGIGKTMENHHMNIFSFLKNKNRHHGYLSRVTLTSFIYHPHPLHHKTFDLKSWHFIFYALLHFPPRICVTMPAIFSHHL